ncbi:protein-export chaperone SecB [Caldisalinibacter kiritimatiensis]|uniref:Preprotein translocase subunit SecB n=1 Tax=Caldisalinibacter kiritimatiensis TaxID=1304284 RepID=R1AWX0_9FIRM|nr:protein-export chaperone SecB [Caldisalinibacter kiritimatiensis]EOD01147.1 hypothetical protein L21TH_0787 [Caldisalinibacter kiritimatiensis]
MRKLRSDDLHNIQLKTIRVVSLSCFVDDNYHSLDNEKIKVETNIGNYGEVISDTEGKTYLKTKIQGKKEDQVVFQIEVVYEGLCISKKILDKKEYEFFLKVQSIPMLWSYTRETVNNIMVKMGLKPILLPVLNITEIIQGINKSKEDVGGDQ